MEQTSLPFGPHILQVSEITAAIRDSLRGDDRLRDAWVEGEIGRVTISSAGHAYFTLKDERSQLNCVFFRSERELSPFEPRSGMRVVAHGRVDVFESQGVYQLYVATLQPSGFGDLAIRLEALKARLAAEGLFDLRRKRPLPERPAVIGVVTSETGAVWHDIQTVLRRRWPLTRVVLAPCVVQGDAAPVSIVAALDRLARFEERRLARGAARDAPQVVIVARGGGSPEDLWSFNDERVVRAIVAHPVPVVSGVGHEVDVTLADLAADVRAPTPSAAAELVVPNRAAVAASLVALGGRQRAVVRRCLADASRDVSIERRALERLRPEAQLASARERAGLLLDRLTRVIQASLRAARDADRRGAAALAPLTASRLAAGRALLGESAAALAALGPEATLARGYAIVRRVPDGLIVRDPRQVPAGTGLAIRVARGELAARVEAPDQPGGD